MILLLVSLIAPLGLQWDEKHAGVQKVKDYKYHFGDVGWGLVVYLGEDLDGLESELQLNYAKGNLASAVLILGPAGLNDLNCLKRYRATVDALNEKYGQFKYQRLVKDPIIEDLVVVEFCNSTSIGLYEVETRWESSRFMIAAELVGDHSGFYIQITYKDTKRMDIYKKEKRKKILQRL